MLAFDIVVVASDHRPVLTQKLLAGLSPDAYQISKTPDYNLPATWRPRYRPSLSNDAHTGAYRCFRGHQDALRLARHWPALVFEDDAVSDFAAWPELVGQAIRFLQHFEVVSLHGRSANMQHWAPDGSVVVDGQRFVFHKPLRKYSRVVGALAYLISASAAKRLCRRQFDGFPVDLMLVRDFRYCFASPSPFTHDRRYGSLVDGTPPTEVV